MSTAAPAFAFDFFISRRGTVAAEAQEVADILQSEGYRVLVQDYDAALGESFSLFIHDALTKARHLLVLHSADYDSTHWTRQEFANFLAAPDARAAERRICVLRCDAADPRGLLSGVVYGDLHGVTDPAERRRIVLAVARGEAPALRPSPHMIGGSVPLDNRLFTGRDDLLAAMDAALATEDDAGAMRGGADQDLTPYRMLHIICNAPLGLRHLRPCGRLEEHAGSQLCTARSRRRSDHPAIGHTGPVPGI